jgi:putative zinc finger protein
MTEATHVGELLSGYLDAALPAAERERVESHLEACAACRAELEALRALQIELGAATPPEPPPGYWERFAGRVEKRLPQPEPAGTGALAARIVAWLLPSGRLAWTRAVGAVATITIVTYVAMHGFRHEEVAIQPRETLGSSPDAARPSARPNAGATAPAERSPEAKPQAEPLPSRSFETRSSPALPAPATTTLGAPSDAAGAKRELGKSAYAAKQQDRLAARETGEAERYDALADEKKVQATGETSAAPAPTPVPALPEGAMNTVAAPRGAVASPQTAPQALKAGPRIESDLAQSAAPATSVENTDVLLFVQAALAGDTGRAHAAWEAFQKVGTAADAEHMRSWLGRVEPAAAGKDLRERSVARMLSKSSTDPAVAQLLDLDALVWPRRGDPSFGATVSDLAGRFEAHAAAGAEPRARAIAYLEWLAVQAPDAASRDLLHARVEKLRD